MAKIIGLYQKQSSNLVKTPFERASHLLPLIEANPENLELLEEAKEIFTSLRNERNRDNLNRQNLDLLIEMICSRIEKVHQKEKKIKAAEALDNRA